MEMRFESRYYIRTYKIRETHN